METRMTDCNLIKLHSLVKMKKDIDFPYNPMWKEMNDCETLK